MQKTLLSLLGFFLFASVASAQGRTFKVPFHTIIGMILLDATVNGQVVRLLLDAGVDNSIVSPSVAGVTVKLDALKPDRTTGASRDYTKARIDLRLEKRHRIERLIVVMDLSEASKHLGMRFDGFFGPRHSQGVFRRPHRLPCAGCGV